jgi:hypothetical protein
MESSMIVKVLGTGSDVVALERVTREALHALGLDNARIETVTDRAGMLAHGVMSTSAVMVDRDVVVSGRIPTPAELQALLAAAPAP